MSGECGHNSNSSSSTFSWFDLLLFCVGILPVALLSYLACGLEAEKERGREREKAEIEEQERERRVVIRTEVHGTYYNTNNHH